VKISASFSWKRGKKVTKSEDKFPPLEEERKKGNQKRR